MSQEYVNMRNKRMNSKPTLQELQKDYNNMSSLYRSQVCWEHFKEHFYEPNPQTFLWHDYEGGGVHATISPSTQFASVRTDIKLNIIDTPTDILCRPPLDNLIHPEAAILTGLSPLMLMKHGMQQHDYFSFIYKEMMVQGTCSVGYNSLSYDDDMTRSGFFRNLLPMYKREYSNGNSRWDIFPVVMAYFATRPGDIVFPTNQEGQPSLKLEDLARANGITQESAHTAIDDVFALLGICKMLKSSNIKLWDYLYQRRSKKAIETDVNAAIMKKKTMIHITGVAGKENYCMQIIKPIGFSHAKNGANILMAIKMDDNLSEWTKLTLAEASERLYLNKAELNLVDGCRPGIVGIKINKCPILLPVSLMNEKLLIERFNLEDSFASKLSQWHKYMEPAITLTKGVLNSNNDFPIPPYIDTALYSYGFASNKDDILMQNNSLLSSEEYMNSNRIYEAAHLQELHSIKMMAINPDSVSSEVKVRLLNIMREKVLKPKDNRASWDQVVEAATNIQPTTLKQEQILNDFGGYLSHIDKCLSLT